MLQGLFTVPIQRADARSALDHASGMLLVANEAMYGVRTGDPHT